MSQTNSLVGGSSKKPRIPHTFNGLQYNFCKSHTCQNFGIEPEPKNSTATIGKYTIVAGGKNYPLLKCNSCNASPPLKSNQGITEELDRISSYLNLSTSSIIPCCPNPDCSNHNIPLGTKKAYRSFGKAASGAKRYQCSLCKKTFAISKLTKGQHDTHSNIDIFKYLVNKVPLSRIINLLGISWNTLYNRIDFIHSQCMEFVSERENKFKTLHIERVYISVDRQEYELNWTQRKDKRNIILSAMTSADNKTGYVFGMNLNFDYSIDKEEIEKDAKNIGDSLLAPPFRKYSRLWLEHDYLNPSKNSKAKKTSTDLVSNIAETYKATEAREDIEAFDTKDATQKLPNYGAQVKAEYTMIAHFYFLKRLLGNVDKFRFFMDQETGIRSACFSAFNEEIKNKTAEAFYVSIEKQLTVDEKRQFKKISEKRFDEIREQFPDLNDSQIKLEMLKEEIQKMLELGHWKDKWVHHPLPNMSEANKAMCWLTEHNEMDLDHKAWLYNKASLHGVDSYFEKIRRRIAMFERPIHSQGNNGRTWNGYAAYNPEIAVKMLEIFRVVHNYVDTRKDKIKVNGVDKTVITTPAMRIGIAKAPIDYKTILYFK